MARRKTWAGEQRAPWQWLTFELLTRVMESGELRREVSVGRIPLRLDAALLGCVPSPDSQRHLPDILSRLWPCTLMEYKGPNESLRAGELHHLVGGAWLALGTELSHIHHSDVGLHVVAPTLSRAFLDDAARAGATVRQQKPGVHVVAGLAFPCVAFEAQVIAGDNPALAFLDPSFLGDPRRMDALIDDQDLLCYVYDIIRGLDPALEATMAQQDARALAELRKRVLAQVLKDSTAEQKLKGLSPEERLKGLPPEERLKGLPPEERLKGLPPEEIVKALTPEDRERLRRLLH